MKTICAWCQEDLPADISKGEGVSHGICPQCAFRLFGVTPQSQDLRSFLDTLPVPVMALDESGRARALNRRGRILLHLEEMEVEGMRPGEVFLCQHAFEAGGCGETVHCSGCVIRRSIMETLRTGERQENVPACLHQGDRTIQMHITTEKVAKAVLMRVEIP